MTRKINRLGLLVAIFALSAVSASSALATEKSFHHDAPSGKATIHAVQTTSEVFTTNAGTMTCKTVTSVGMLEVPTTMELTMAPTYGGCSAFGFINIPIHSNGCHYLYTTATTTGGAIQPNPITHITCPPGKAIEITTPFCPIKIGPQTLQSLSFTTGSSGGKKDLTIVKNLTNIHYDECGTTRTNGTWTGQTTAVATDTVGGAAANLWYE